MNKYILYIIIILLLPCSLHAATITVNDTSDANGSNPLGICTLREAIIAANTDTPVDGCASGSGDDIINLPVGTYVLSMSGVDEDAAKFGDLDITSNIKLVGSGALNTIIDGSVIDRVIHVDPTCAGIVAEISGVTLRNGMTPNSTDNIKLSGGGINNCGNLTIFDVVVSGNKTFNTNSFTYIGHGAGIFNQAKGVLIGTNALIFGNSQTPEGGGVANEGTLQLSNSKIDGNSTYYNGGAGGGIANRGVATLVNTTVSSNLGFGLAGGIFNLGQMQLVNSTVSNNTVVNYLAGGIYNEYTGVLDISNSTISGNSARSVGGGIYNKGLMSLANVTVANNNVTLNLGGGIMNADQGVLTVENSLLSNNKVAGLLSNCTLSAGSITDYGYNLENGNSCGFVATGDKVNVDPLLLSLQDNGGVTFTHALTAGSPAIDAGNPAGCKAEGGTRDLLNDQRSLLRPIDGDGNGSAICDIGAYEFGAVPTTGSDLSIQGWGLPNPVALDGTLTYNIVATNNGPLMADGVVITVKLSPNVSWVSTATNKGICIGTRTVQCFVGSLSKADSVMPAIVVKVNAVGLLNSTVTVESATPDPVLSNNNTTVTTTTSGLFPARRMDGTTQVGSYLTLQEAFDAAVYDDVIEAMATIFSENVTIDSGIPIGFKGGYNSDFSSRTGYTTILGGLRVKSGKLGVQYLKIR